MNAITSFIKRYPLVVFYAISIGGFYLGAVLFMLIPNLPEALLPLFIYATALGGLLVTAVTEGRAGVRAWASRIVRWRVGLLWYVAALSIGPMIRLAAFGLNVALGAPGPQPGAWAGLAEVPFEFLFIFLTIALGEELGFRGYALPKLLERYSPLTAALISGVMRVIWHIPLVVVAGDSAWVFVIVMAGDILFTWLFLNTRGSVLIAMLLHTALNSVNVVFGPMIPEPYQARYTLLTTVVFVVVAAGVIAIYGRNLMRRPAPVEVEAPQLATSGTD
jgi:membrane protease YdiL (CAAX protease family)